MRIVECFRSHFSLRLPATWLSSSIFSKIPSRTFALGKPHQGLLRGY
ncbi:hypothetical protein [Rubritalea tangerina]